MRTGITRRAWLQAAAFASASAATRAHGTGGTAAKASPMGNHQKEGDGMTEMLDVVVVGGGPGGLSAALYLGRSRRDVLVIDEGAPRHAVSEGVRNFLTREGMAPAALREVAWEQMAPYETVRSLRGRVDGLRWLDGRWEVALSDGTARLARAVVLATGVVDEHPEIPGYAERWGRSIHHCPFCHGWEMRDRPLGALIDPALGVHLPRMLRGWSRDVQVFTHGRSLSDAHRAELADHGLPLIEMPIAELRGEGQALAEVVLEDGTTIAREGLFVAAAQHLPPLIQTLELARTDQGYIAVDFVGQTSLPMMWAVGDLTSRMQQVLEAAAQGGRAAASIQRGFLFDS
jgi:thioredoxin reductase